jgi:hypothetical protein
MYIISDYGRTEEEIELVDEVRLAIESAICWPCEIVKDYAYKNRGVYQSIAEGALRVFQSEEMAIFLEDDNLPEISFFRYCEEMLVRYYNNQRILWVCGTNYFGEYVSPDGSDYKFTQHMLPCGWASWSWKFTRYYDAKFSLLDNKSIVIGLRKRFETDKLYHMYNEQWKNELIRIKLHLDPVSWDYQMCLTLRAHNLLGIVPMRNQIRNIGVDVFSTHGGSSFDNIMTRRYCGMKSYGLIFPLTHPRQVERDMTFEKRLGNIIAPPINLRIRIRLGKIIRRVLGINRDTCLKDCMKRNISK